VHFHQRAPETVARRARAPAGGTTVGTLPAACRAAGFEANIAFQTDDPMAWQGLVAADVGIAVIPQRRRDDRLVTPAIRALRV
jgi:DNA-binding transcriptional LysR family regulator